MSYNFFFTSKSGETYSIDLPDEVIPAYRAGDIETLEKAYEVAYRRAVKVYFLLLKYQKNLMSWKSERFLLTYENDFGEFGSTYEEAVNAFIGYQLCRLSIREAINELKEAQHEQN